MATTSAKQTDIRIIFALVIGTGIFARWVPTFENFCSAPFPSGCHDPPQVPMLPLAPLPLHARPVAAPITTTPGELRIFQSLPGLREVHVHPHPSKTSVRVSPPAHV